MKCRIHEFFSLVSIELNTISSYRNSEYFIAVPHQINSNIHLKTTIVSPKFSITIWFLL